MSVQDAKLKQFIDRGGYDAVKQITRGKRKGQWRGVSEASRRTGISRPTIYAILEKHPNKPSKVTPKYVENLKDSEGYKLFVQIYGKKLGKGDLQQSIRHLKIAFKKLNYKAPETWTEEDYHKLWYDPDFHSDECKGINKRIGIYFRRMMRVTDNHNLLEKFKYNSPPDGKKKQWFLHEEEIKKLIRVIEEEETLMLLFVGISTGGRYSALDEITVKDIDFYDKTINVHEKKTGDYVAKNPPYAIFDLLKEYIEDLNLSPEDKIFPKGYDYHLKKLGKAGKTAKLKKIVSTHILKHTFVTQARRHRVSAEVIVNQTGTELRTLEKFYTGKDEEKIRFEMQGIQYDAVPFHEWILALGYFFRARYKQLKD